MFDLADLLVAVCLPWVAGAVALGLSVLVMGGDTYWLLLPTYGTVAAGYIGVLVVVARTL